MFPRPTRLLVVQKASQSTELECHQMAKFFSLFSVGVYQDSFYTKQQHFTLRIAQPQCFFTTSKSHKTLNCPLRNYGLVCNAIFKFFYTCAKTVMWQPITELSKLIKSEHCVNGLTSVLQAMAIAKNFLRSSASCGDCFHTFCHSAILISCNIFYSCSK